MGGTINGILSLGAQTLKVAQAAVNVTGQNIANASTPGYTRQEVVLKAQTPTYFTFGALGTGVAIEDVTRIRDQFIDGTFRRESGNLGLTQGRSEILSRVETVLNEPGTLGVSAALDNFFNSWSEFATNPTDTTVQRLVRENGDRLAQRFNDLATKLDQLRQDGEDRLNQAVERVNALTDEVSRLNRDIIAIESGGISAGDLRDARDRALDELSSLVDINVREREDGSVGVTLQGYTIADRDETLTLETRQVGGEVRVAIAGRSGTLAGMGGRVEGLVRGLNEDLAGARARLDDLASALVADVNALHRTGMSSDGSTGLDFFDPAGTTASSLALSAAVAADAGVIAAGTPDGLGAYRAGVNDVALAIAEFRDGDSPTLGAGFQSSVQGLVSDVGLAVRTNDDASQVAQSLRDGAASRRESLSGVSTDEELINLIQFQTTYQAAARIITTADELLQTVLSI